MDYLDKRIIKMYKELINEYGASLQTSTERAVCRRVIKELMDELFSPEEIYWLLWNLGNKSLIDYKSLLFNQVYRIESQRIISNVREAHNDYKPTESAIEAGLLMAEMSEEEADIENMDEMDIYIKYYLKPTLSISKQTYRDQKEAEIKMLKESKTFVDFREIPNHPYTNYEMDREIKRLMDIQQKEARAAAIFANQKEQEVITIYR